MVQNLKVGKSPFPVLFPSQISYRQPMRLFFPTVLQGYLLHIQANAWDSSAPPPFFKEIIASRTYSFTTEYILRIMFPCEHISFPNENLLNSKYIWLDNRDNSESARVFPDTTPSSVRAFLSWQMLFPPGGRQVLMADAVNPGERFYKGNTVHTVELAPRNNQG